MTKLIWSLAAIAAVTILAVALFDLTAAHLLTAHASDGIFGAMVAMPSRAAFASGRRVSIPGPRGIRSVRAEASPSLAEIKALIDGVNKTFADFKTENDAALAAVKKDVVQTEKVDRINTAIDKQQKMLDDLSAQLAALKIGGAGDAPSTEVVAHKKAFNGYFRKGADANLRDLEVKASLTTSSDPDGGYLVPRETETAIDTVLRTVSAMRDLATVRTISSAGYKKPVNLGGASAGWVGETESRTETTPPNFSLLDFPAMELYAEPAATQALLDDAAVDIAAWLADEVSLAFADQEGAAFITGDGVSRPRGILSYTNIADGSYAWGKIGFIGTGVSGDFAATDPGDNLIDLQTALKTGYQANATWMMNRKTQAKVRKFKDSNHDYLWQVSIQSGKPATLLGMPVVTDDNMPDPGANTYSVAYGDFKRAYLVIDRLGIRVLRDPYTNKPYVMFYTTKRVGGGVQNFEAVKLLKFI